MNPISVHISMKLVILRLVMFTIISLLLNSSFHIGLLEIHSSTGYQVAEWLEWLSIHVVSHVYSIFSFWLAMRDGFSAFALFYLQTFSIIRVLC